MHDIDIFVDIEFNHEGIFLFGAYCPQYRHIRLQLYEKTLTIRRLTNFISQCRRPNRETLVFCHGPDFGHIENKFKIDFKNQYTCINSITAYRYFTRYKYFSLAHLASKIGLGWKDPGVQQKISALWRSNDAQKRQRVLDYNWDDCKNLGGIIKELRQRGVTTRELKDYAKLS